MRRFGLLMGLALLFALACDESTENDGCAEGAYEQCTCDSGATGTRLCSNGEFGDCVCSTPLPPVDACDGVQCEAHEQCVSGACQLLPGRCDSNDDCLAETPVCDGETNTCVAAEESDLCGGEVCPSYKSCLNDECVLSPGACESDNDCTEYQPKCDIAAHACVARCHGVSCESYEQCDESTGACELAEGRCANDSDCPSERPNCSSSHVCVEDLNNDPCNGVTCESHEYCSEGNCLLNPGRCDVDGDCSGSTPKCDTSAHNCVARCHGVSCESYEQCVEATGTCELKAGACESDGDCSGSTPKCDTGTHTCVADAETSLCAGVTCTNGAQCDEATGHCVNVDEIVCAADSDCPSFANICDDLGACVDQNQCTWRTCDPPATCTNNGGYAQCNCVFGYKHNVGSGCLALTEDEAVVWCGIQWVTGWDNNQTDFSVGDEVIVYAQVYVPNVTGQGREEPNGVKAELLTTTGEVILPLEIHRFTRIPATRNEAFSCSDNSCNNHEYMAALPTSEAANLRFVFRYSRDNGTSWNYCGVSGEDSLLNASSTADKFGTVNIR
ncbi:MAG: hypothetical protein IKC51_00460 [Myxococcaceae bacterium]|nr:hypothetical protein [Myxococcaceae bacterium]